MIERSCYGLFEGHLLQLLISHEFVCRWLQLLFDGFEHFVQVQACYPGEDVLHSWICKLGLCTVCEGWGTS